MKEGGNVALARVKNYTELGVLPFSFSVYSFNIVSVLVSVEDTWASAPLGEGQGLGPPV